MGDQPAKEKYEGSLENQLASCKGCMKSLNRKLKYTQRMLIESQAKCKRLTNNNTIVSDICEIIKKENPELFWRAVETIRPETKDGKHIKKGEISYEEI